jgi:hypothetical protein
MSETSDLKAYFGDLSDPRVIGWCEYKLVEIILIAICAILSGFALSLGADSGFHAMLVIIWSLASWCLKKQRNNSDCTNIFEGARAPFSHSRTLNLVCLVRPGFRMDAYLSQHREKHDLFAWVCHDQNSPIVTNAAVGHLIRTIIGR